MSEDKGRVMGPVDIMVEVLLHLQLQEEVVRVTFVSTAQRCSTVWLSLQGEGVVVAHAVLKLVEQEGATAEMLVKSRVWWYL
jgi:hypothetical protein